MAQDRNIPHELNREALLKGTIREHIRASDPTMELASDEEHRASVAAILAARPDGGGDVWLFAYGSLIWNPIIHFVERRLVTVRGYHRRFCLWTHLGRGSPEAPGLILGLEHGGACRGVAYRIAAALAQEELELVWRREMLTNVYRPRWVKFTAPEGGGAAIAFLINTAHPRYAGLLPEDQVVESIARARGSLGACATYLFNTADHLAALGIRDRQLSRLQERVKARIESLNC